VAHIYFRAPHIGNQDQNHHEKQADADQHQQSEQPGIAVALEQFANEIALGAPASSVHLPARCGRSQGTGN